MEMVIKRLLHLTGMLTVLVVGVIELGGGGLVWSVLELMLLLLLHMRILPRSLHRHVLVLPINLKARMHRLLVVDVVRVDLSLGMCLALLIEDWILHIATMRAVPGRSVTVGKCTLRCI